MAIKIKLFVSGKTEDGTILLRSQLALITNVNSHTLKYRKLCFWNGKDFEETNEPYQIVNSIKEMKYQQL